MSDVNGHHGQRHMAVVDEDADCLDGERSGSYCFKWHDYRNHLSAVIQQLFEEDCMVDVTLSAAGERIHAHRIVLCACSPLFQEVLGQVNEDYPTIILTDVSARDVRSIIEFAYHGEVRIPVENIESLLDTARSLKIYGLTEVDDVPDLRFTPENLAKDEDRDLSLDRFESQSSVVYEEKPNVALEESCENQSSSRMLPHHCPTMQKCAGGPAADSYLGSAIADTGDDKLSINGNNGRKRGRREATGKRDYSEDMLVSAINDLRAGQTLIEASTRHNIPRSTLYMRAKSLGIRLNASRNEYPAECMKAAIDAVIGGGSSLQHASEMFGIPKTVLWRRIQKEGYQILRSDVKRTYGTENREAAVKALERGENLTKVALEFKIPKTTLFRDKARLVDEGKLPVSFWKKRRTDSEESKKFRLEEAVAACKGGRMSQAAASVAYHIPKTTIWRRLQRQQRQNDRDDEKLADVRSPNQLGKIHKRNGRRISWGEPLDRQEGERSSSLATLSSQSDSDFAYCEMASQAVTVSGTDAIPITYMDESGIPEESVIILTTNSVVEGLDLEEGEHIIVNSEQSREYIPCGMSIEETTDYHQQRTDS